MNVSINVMHSFFRKAWTFPLWESESETEWRYLAARRSTTGVLQTYGLSVDEQW